MINFIRNLFNITPRNPSYRVDLPRGAYVVASTPEEAAALAQQAIHEGEQQHVIKAADGSQYVWELNDDNLPVRRFLVPAQKKASVNDVLLRTTSRQPEWALNENGLPEECKVAPWFSVDGADTVSASNVTTTNAASINTRGTIATNNHPIINSHEGAK